MLAVIFLNINIATQKNLFIAKKINFDRHRILSILIKLNFVDKGTKPTIVKFIKKKRYKLNLGWYLIRNPG
jgi:hypothetical protein